MSEADVTSHLAPRDALTDERRELTATRLGLYGLVIILVASIVVGEIYPALTSLMCMLLVGLPLMVRRRLCMPLPWTMAALTAAVTVLHSAGILLSAYDLVWWWDLLTHFMATSVLAVAANLVILVRGRQAVPRALPTKYVPLVSLGLVIVLGMVWEAGEFTVDMAFGLKTQYSLQDTAIDLSVDILGGVLVAIVIPPYLNGLEEDYGICDLSPAAP